jgi:hypothetical protein
MSPEIARAGVRLMPADKVEFSIAPGGVVFDVLLLERPGRGGRMLTDSTY